MDRWFRHLLRLLKDSSVSKIEISAGPPFVKLVFDKVELLTLLQGKSQISDLVAKCFVRRRVFWIDFRSEEREAVLQSLVEVEALLDESSAALSSVNDASVVALAKVARSWASAASLVRKELADRLHGIDDEKASIAGYDSANEDRVAALQAALVSLRQRIYPLVAILIGFLADDDATKIEAQVLLDSGLNLVPDAKIQRECIPDVDEFDS